MSVGGDGGNADAPDAVRGDTSVELWAAALPLPLAPVAWHYWFVVSCPETGGVRTRFEVWQTRNAGGISSGHVHRALMRPESGVGCGPAAERSRWTGEAAQALAAVLLASFEIYPHRERYLAWPGPNSNTFVAWALERAAALYPPLAADACAVLDPRAVGKDFGERRWGAQAGPLPGGRGWRASSPLLGVRAWRDGGRRGWSAEASLLGLTLAGWTPGFLLTPFGRVPVGAPRRAADGEEIAPEGGEAFGGASRGVVVASRPKQT